MPLTLRRHPVLALAAVAFLTSACSSGASAEEGVPTVSGSFGEQPEITIPDDATSPDELVVEVLEQGDGDEVVSGDLLVANYLGEVYDSGEVFDTSFDSDEPAAFGIGVGGVIPGWDEGLVGQQVGSRVELVIPPDLAYGDQSPSEQIPADSTLVFVVDVVDTISHDDNPGGEPTGATPKGAPTISGEPGEPATIEIGDAKPRKNTRTTLMISGSGDPIDPDRPIAVDVSQRSYSGDQESTTFDSAPLSTQVAAISGLAEALEGQALGSRVLSEVSEKDGGGEPVAAVIDVIGQY